MGGCASRPRDADLQAESAPEGPSTPKKVEADTAPHEKSEGGDSKNEAPLVDLSESKVEEGAGDSSFATKAGESAAVSSTEGRASVVTKATEEKVEDVAKVSEDTKVGAIAVTEEKTTKEQAEVTSTDAVKDENNDAPQTSAITSDIVTDKSNDAPLVTV